jgi:S1-C subfamily serine protease
VLAAGQGLGYVLGQGRGAPPAPVPAPETGAETTAAAPAAPAPGVGSGLTAPEETTIALFEAARDSVVAISTSTQVFNPFTRRVSDRPAGSGSGFLWDDAGHVVTNNHVIAGVTAATVQLADGRSLPATLVGADPLHDLAVLRITAENLPGPLVPAATPPRVGQTVLAIGNPFGLDWTLTTGIVSALDRDLPGQQGRMTRGLIQTDAAINPGNSGGPLLDSSGRLIGVNTAIWSPSGASAGIGFAVPAATVQRIVPQLIANGRYTPPGLGILWDARINAAVNRQGLAGVLVLDVVPGTDAAAADLRPARLSRDGRILPGDVIVGIDGSPVANLDDLLAALDIREPGDRVEVRLSRDGQERVVTLALVPGG